VPASGGRSIVQTEQAARTKDAARRSVAVAGWESRTPQWVRTYPPPHPSRLGRFSDETARASGRVGAVLS
jgi:hypothetical protein